MNTVISMASQIVELCNQVNRRQILPSTAIDKIEIKALKLRQDVEKLSALLCASCDELGQPESNDLTVELGAARDE